MTIDELFTYLCIYYTTTEVTKQNLFKMSYPTCLPRYDLKKINIFLDNESNMCPLWKLKKFTDKKQTMLDHQLEIFSHIFQCCLWICIFHNWEHIACCNFDLPFFPFSFSQHISFRIHYVSRISKPNLNWLKQIQEIIGYRT